MTYANTFTPSYAKDDPDYSPWVVTHKREELLNPEIIQVLFRKFLEKPEMDIDDPDLLDRFYKHLEEIGYGTYYHNWPPIVLNVPDSKE